MPTTHLLIIDPQVDFCDPEWGSLYVPGAERDVERLARLVTDGPFIDQLHVTLDTHPAYHIANPAYWRNPTGAPPEPFTVVTPGDVRAGRWRTADPAKQEHAQSYVDGLEQGGRYQLVIWPYHCLLGTPGHAVMPPLREALRGWEIRRARPVDYILKGRNPDTEHYSAIKAELPIPSDPETQTSRALVDLLRGVDTLLVGGEAGSHCVANTVRDLIDAAGNEYAPGITLLADAISPVTSFESYQADFIKDMNNKGMNITTVEAVLRSR